MERSGIPVYQHSNERQEENKAERSQTRAKRQLQEENENVNKGKPVCWERKEPVRADALPSIYPRIRADPSNSISPSHHETYPLKSDMAWLPHGSLIRIYL